VDWIPLLLSACLGALASGGARRACLAVGFVSADRRVAFDGRPVTFGGVAAPLAGLGIAVALGLASQPLVVALLGFGLLGLADDAVELSVPRKLLGQLVASVAVGVAAWADGGALEALLLVPACVVLANGVNLVDVADGLAGGLAVLALLALAPGLASAELVLACATLGFLSWNWPRARLYLGDAGAMALGAALAVGVVGAVLRGEAVQGTLAVAPFLAELAVLILLRTRAGIPFWSKSPDHMVMRLRPRLPDRAWPVPLLWAWAATGQLAGLVGGPLPQLAVLASLPCLVVIDAIRTSPRR